MNPDDHLCFGKLFDDDDDQTDEGKAMLCSFLPGIAPKCFPKIKFVLIESNEKVLTVFLRTIAMPVPALDGKAFLAASSYSFLLVSLNLSLLASMHTLNKVQKN
ncbi:hypothetical protein Y032_0638g970 [Ancylostoma ceylanicum]|uniref:Uncharacterized protein n=1 Tax=Ancylostoma ceylanicum TaxID=53326 RepID=A0A016WLE5_9BILA|nr:hypothetical protein Y032_0638g970 [Ancylostoma ceylanicum]